MMSNPFKRGSTPAILWSIARLIFWVVIAGVRVTLRALRRCAYFGLGFWIGYAVLSAHRRAVR